MTLVKEVKGGKGAKFIELKRRKDKKVSKTIVVCLRKKHIKRVHEVCETRGRLIGAKRYGFFLHITRRMLMWQQMKMFFFSQRTPLPINICKIL